MRTSFDRGVTLVEVMLAAGILIFALSGMLALFIHCMNLNQASRHTAEASSHAQMIVEQIRTTNFGAIEGNITQWNLTTSQLQSSPYSLNTLTNETAITNVTISGNPLGISVTVAWDERGSRSMSTRVDTLLTDY